MLKKHQYRLLAFATVLGTAPFLLGATVGDDIAENATRLSITGQGFDSQPATAIQIIAGVEAFAPRASDAVRRNADSLDQMRRALKRYGVSDKDFSTSALTLSPTRRHERGESVEGFEVSHSLSVTFRKPEDAGMIIDRLVDAGATNIRGPIMTWDADPGSAARARKAAVTDAVDRANVYAKTLGMKVRRIVSINDSSGYRAPRPAAMNVAVSTTRIDPADENVMVSVGVVFELTKI